jgi:hypothetical protein
MAHKNSVHKTQYSRLHNNEIEVTNTNSILEASMSCHVIHLFAFIIMSRILFHSCNFLYTFHYRLHNKYKP